MLCTATGGTCANPELQTWRSRPALSAQCCLPKTSLLVGVADISGGGLKGPGWKVVVELPSKAGREQGKELQPAEGPHRTKRAGRSTAY